MSGHSQVSRHNDSRARGHCHQPDSILNHGRVLGSATMWPVLSPKGPRYLISCSLPRCTCLC